VAAFLAKDAADKAVLEKILESVPEGSIVFAVPKEMPLGSTAVVELLLSPSSSVGDLKQMVEEGGKRYGAKIRMASNMEENLQGSNFQIDPVTPEILKASPPESHCMEVANPSDSRRKPICAAGSQRASRHRRRWGTGKSPNRNVQEKRRSASKCEATCCELLDQ
jgi:hypothetical protein